MRPERHNTTGNLSWIIAPQKTAVRHESGDHYYVLPGQDDKKNAWLGAALALARPNKELDADPATCPRNVRLYVNVFGIPQKAGWALAVVLFALTVSGFWYFRHQAILPVSQSIGNFKGFLVHILCGFLSYSLCVFWQGSVITKYCKNSSCLTGLSRISFGVETVVWRLGIPVSAAWLAIVVPLVFALSCLAWLPVFPAVFSGLFVGAWIYVLVHLFPLRPCCGTRIGEGILHVDDLSEKLRWAVAARFLPAGQSMESGGGSAMAFAAVFLAAWLVLFGLTLKWWAQRPLAGTGPFAMLWLGLVSVFSVFFILFALRELSGLFRAAYLIGGRGEIKPFEPSDELVTEFKDEVALIRHLPQLTKAPWKWMKIPPGTFLIRHGETERIFYWIHTGEARVFVRTKENDVVCAATLYGKTGIGEISFLDNRKRTADVLITRPTIAAALSYEDFLPLVNKKSHGLFRAIVLAGQAFLQSPVFSGIPDREIQLWIRMGKPLLFSKGQVIIKQGADDQWMGLVVHGQAVVAVGKKPVALLNIGDVVGEMAFLENSTRKATVVARTRVLLWKWPARWLSSEVDRIGLRDALMQLARQREENTSENR